MASVNLSDVAFYFSTCHKEVAIEGLELIKEIVAKRNGASEQVKVKGKKRGPKPGSKRVAKVTGAPTPYVEGVKRRGRPPGSKNKSKPDADAEQPVTQSVLEDAA